MKTGFQATAFSIILACALWMPGAVAAPQTVPEHWQMTYDNGVEAYRTGTYENARKAFQQITEAIPECQEAHYYLAISLAQLNRHKEARQAYENVIRLAPQTEAAALAKEGLENLPDLQALDAPPRFKKRAAQKDPATAPVTSAMEEISPTPSPSPTPQPATPMAGMDPQALQMMMMLGGMGGGNNTGGFNPMMWSYLQSMGGQTGGQNTQTNMPPEMLKTMMMNQMMQNFDPFSSGKDD